MDGAELQNCEWSRGHQRHGILIRPFSVCSGGLSVHLGRTRKRRAQKATSRCMGDAIEVAQVPVVLPTKDGLSPSGPLRKNASNFRPLLVI
jgi:hypothetical protein